MEKLSIEWELLSHPILASDFNETKYLKPSPFKTHVQRDSSYLISLKMSGHGVRLGYEAPRPNLRDGEILEGEDLVGKAEGGYLVHISKVTKGNQSIRGDGTFLFDARSSKVVCTFDETQAATKIVEYCAGDPGLQIWSRPTDRACTNDVARKRDVSDSHSPDHWSSQGKGESSDLSVDSALFKTKLGEVLVAQVPGDIAPSWLNPVSIQYGPIADAAKENFREKMIEALSFAFGKRLIPVGFSEYNDKDDLLRATAIRPWALNLAAEAAQVARPPANYGDQYTAEEPITKLMDLYLENRDIFNLQDVMWSLWIAETQPLGINLVPYAAALETLANAWLSSNKTKSKGVFVPEPDFSNFMGPKISSLVASLPPEPEGWRKVANKLKSINQFGSNQRISTFFDEIGMPIGEVEETIMWARNKFAHGGTTSESHNQWLLNVCRGYRTLVHRALLKVMDYSGEYIDYSTYGYPTRPINDPMKGPQDDGKLARP